MSWFVLGDQKDRSRRVGICLRYNSLPDDLRKRIRKMLMFGEYPMLISVQKLLDNNQVILEVRVSSLWAGIRAILRAKNPPDYHRVVVYRFVADEDMKWVCEGNYGRGLSGPTPGFDD